MRTTRSPAGRRCTWRPWIARVAGETAARRGLEAIFIWGEAHACDLDDRLMIVDFLLVAWVELARLELWEGSRARAAELVA